VSGGTGAARGSGRPRCLAIRAVPWQDRIAMTPFRPPRALVARLACAAAGARVLVAVLASSGRGQAALPLDVAVRQALRDGPEAQIARLRTGAADDTAAAARSIYWPRATISSQAGWSNRQDDTINAIDGQGRLKRYPLSTQGSSEPWIGVYVDQMLFDLRQWRAAEREALEADAAVVAEAQQREVISATVLDRYLDVVRLDGVVGLDRRRLADAEWLAHQSGVLLDAGRTLASERDQAVLEVEQVRLDAEQHRAELAEAQAALARAIGSEPGAPAPSIVAASLPVIVDAAPPLDGDTALAAAPELRILALRCRMDELAVDMARAGRYPTLALRGGYFHYGTQRFDAFEQEVAVGVDLQVPVFDGFQASNSIDGASKAAAAARLRLETLRDEKQARAGELQRRLRVALQQPALAERRASMAAERQRLADLSVQGQRGSVAQALTARGEASRAAQAALDAQLERVRAWAALQREQGRLAAALVGEPAAEAAVAP